MLCRVHLVTTKTKFSECQLTDKASKWISMKNHPFYFVNLCKKWTAAFIWYEIQCIKRIWIWNKQHGSIMCIAYWENIFSFEYFLFVVMDLGGIKRPENCYMKHHIHGGICTIRIDLHISNWMCLNIYHFTKVFIINTIVVAVAFKR